MAAWQLTWQLLRGELRRRHLWRTRALIALLFAVTGAWAAAAPQAALGLGERLRFAFDAVFGLSAILAATAGIRNDYEFCERHVSSRSVAVSEWMRDLFRAGLDLIGAAPIVAFTLAVQAVSIEECAHAIAVICLLTVASISLRVFGSHQFPIWVFLAGAGVVFLLARRRNLFEIIMITLFVAHVGIKATITRAAVALTAHQRPNLILEAFTPMTSEHAFSMRRAILWRRFGWLICSLVLVNILVIALLVSGAALPVTLEQKLALGLMLALGAALLLLDASALAWRGLLGGIKTASVNRSFSSIFAGVIGVPWAVAWAFSAMHAGEAFTLNEGAAYFFLWSALGATISWASGGAAREKLHRDLRQMLAED